MGNHKKSQWKGQNTFLGNFLLAQTEISRSKVLYNCQGLEFELSHLLSLPCYLVLNCTQNASMRSFRVGFVSAWEWGVVVVGVNVKINIFLHTQRISLVPCNPCRLNNKKAAFAAFVIVTSDHLDKQIVMLLMMRIPAEYRNT